MTRLLRNRIDGIAEPLPDGEVVLWSGKPDPWAYTLRLLKLHWVAVWFAGLAIWRGVEAWQEGAGAAGALLRALGQLPLAASAIGLLAGIGYLMARDTTYALTARRLVFQVGVALPITINMPLRFIDAVGIMKRSAGHSDLILTLVEGATVRTFALWPNVRTAKGGVLQPMMRDVRANELALLIPLLTDALQKTQVEAPEASASDAVEAAPVGRPDLGSMTQGFAA